MKTPLPPPLPPNSLNLEFYGWDKLKSTFEDVKTLIDSESERINRRVRKRRYYFRGDRTNTSTLIQVRKKSFWTGVAEVGGLSYVFFDRRYLVRLGVSLIFFFVTGYLNALASAAAGWRTPNVRFLDLQGRETSANTLPDFGHDVVTLLCKRVFGEEYEYIDMFELPDMFVAVFTPLCLIFIVLHPRRFMIFRRVFVIFGILNLLRSFTVVVTSLPDASPACHAQFKSIDTLGAYKSQPFFPTGFAKAALLMTQRKCCNSAGSRVQHTLTHTHTHSGTTYNMRGHDFQWSLNISDSMCMCHA